jgi:hypothetical protein
MLTRAHTFKKKLRDRKFIRQSLTAFQAKSPIIDKKIERKYLRTLSEFRKYRPWPSLCPEHRATFEPDIQ